MEVYRFQEENGDYTFQGKNGGLQIPEGRMEDYRFHGRSGGWNTNNNASEFRASGKNSGPDLLIWKTSMGICKGSQGAA